MKLWLQLRAALRWWPAALALGVTAITAGSAALLQAQNADQLVNGFLFESPQTFSGAIFPLEHTQLIKWPLFALLSVWHFAPALYVGLTVLLAVVTIAGLLYVLYRICKRTPRVFDTLCILLASVLVLVPVQVFDGGVAAPLSLAMLTGRNIEYVIFIGVLLLYLKTPSLRAKRWASGTALLSLLFANDNLFMYFSVGGALVFGMAALLQQNLAFKRLARFWLAGSVAAWALSLAWLAVITQTLTHLVSYPLGYEPVASLPEAWQGVAGTAQALALNFGLTARAGVGAWPAFALNAVVLGLVVWAAVWLVKQLFKTSKQPAAMHFAAMALATAIAAVGGFALTNQPYVQNARYLSFAFFAGFIVLAVWLRTVRLPKMTPFIVAGACIVALALGAALQHNTQLAAQNALAQRNQKIATALQQHHVEFVAGNYWRVVPIRALTPQASQAIMPLQGCIQKTPVLTSRTWRPEVLTHSFAYLLTAQATGVPQQTCTKQLIEQQYGKPSTEVIIAGSHESPKETLLFYDDGAAAKTPRLAQ